LDHAINDLKERMRATIELNRENGVSDKGMRKEIITYVLAINALEIHHYSQVKTYLEDVLYL